MANAPKNGDKEAWAPRIAKGADALVQSALLGVPPTMPPKGGRPDLPDGDISSAVHYMISLNQ